jgi:hypothetical protein
MKKIISILLIAATVLVSCKKNNNNGNTCITAKVEYGGDPAADGLGWILVTDTNTRDYLPPENLPAGFQVDGKWVDVCYVTTDKDFVCFCMPPYKKMVHISSIKNH